MSILHDYIYDTEHELDPEVIRELRYYANIKDELKDSPLSCYLVRCAKDPSPEIISYLATEASLYYKDQEDYNPLCYYIMISVYHDKDLRHQIISLLA